MKIIKCSEPLKNFEGKPLFSSPEDKKANINHLTVGRYLADYILVNPLDETDDPQAYYKLAKRLYHEKQIEIDDLIFAKLLEKIIKSKNITLLVKGQILEILTK